MSAPDEPATTEAAKQIKAISKDTVHKICSGQVKKTVFNPFDNNGNVFMPPLIVCLFTIRICFYLGRIKFGDRCKGAGRKCTGCWCYYGRSKSS